MRATQKITGPAANGSTPSAVAADGTRLGGDVPPLPDDDLLGMFRLMLFARQLTDRAFSLQRQGRLGTIAGATGQEASIVGSAWALDATRDWVVPQYRELVAMLRQGVPLSQLLLYFIGHPAARRFADDVKAMPIQISLAAQLPHAVGLAWGMRQQGDDGVVLTYFGEGSASEGDFHEAVNLAGTRAAPVVFLLQNNGWAISTPARRQTMAESLASRAIGYGIAGEQVDGNDVLAVHDATARAVARARAGEGPTLIEALTFRRGPHNTAGDDGHYMDADEFEEWTGRDPIDRMRSHLRGVELIDEEREAALAEGIDAEIDAAVAEAESYPPAGIEGLFDEVYTSPPLRLQRQRAQAESEASG